MIQRIQTIYIFLAALIVSLLFWLDYAELVVNSELYVFNARGILLGEQVVISGLPVWSFTGFIVLIHIVVIFMFKNRIRQMRFLVFTIILLLGLIGLYFYFLFAGFENMEVVYKIPMAFPLIAVILDYLAIRSIGMDEALVRSLDRIR